MSVSLRRAGRDGCGDVFTVCDEVLGDVEDNSDVEATGEVRGVDQADHTTHHTDQSQGGLIDGATRGAWRHEEEKGERNERMAREEQKKQRIFVVRALRFFKSTSGGTSKAVTNNSTSELWSMRRGGGADRSCASHTVVEAFSFEGPQSMY